HPEDPPLSLHDALPISMSRWRRRPTGAASGKGVGSLGCLLMRTLASGGFERHENGGSAADIHSRRVFDENGIDNAIADHHGRARSEEHTSALQSRENLV